MTKKQSIDLVGRAAELLDLNATAVMAEPIAAPPPHLPEIAPNVLPEPVPAAATEIVPADVIIARAAAAPEIQSPAPETPVRPNADSRAIGLEWERLYQEGYLTPQNQRSLTAEEFRIIKRPLLRTAFNRDGTQRRLGHMAMITSPCPGDGKTFTSINLALSIASEHDLHVLLVDCDIRRMGLSRALGLGDRVGLMDLLTQPKLGFSDVAVHTSLPNLSVIPAGRPLDGSTEIFASQTMAKFARDVAGRYRDRFIIFDTPPVLASSEPGVLASLVGHVVVVVKANETHKGAVTQTVNMFDPSTPLTFVLNKVSQSSSPDRFGYYDYRHANTDT